MATKKPSKKSKKVVPSLGAADSPMKGPVVKDGVKCFSAYDLSRYDLEVQKVVNLQQMVKLKVYEMDQFQREANNALSKMSSDLERTKHSLKGEETRLRELQAEMQSLYNLDFSQLTYDQETGKLMMNDAPVPAL